MQCPTTGKNSSLKINSQLYVCFKHLKHLFHLVRRGPITNNVDHSSVFNGLSPPLRPQKETKSYSSSFRLCCAIRFWQPDYSLLRQAYLGLALLPRKRLLS